MQTHCGRFDNGEKTGGVCDGTARGTVGGDVRGVQPTGHSKHAVGVCDNWEKVGGVDDGYTVDVCDNGEKTEGRIFFFMHFFRLCTVTVSYLLLDLGCVTSCFSVLCRFEYATPTTLSRSSAFHYMCHRGEP